MSPIGRWFLSQVEFYPNGEMRDGIYLLSLQTHVMVYCAKLVGLLPLQ